MEEKITIIIYPNLLSILFWEILFLISIDCWRLFFIYLILPFIYVKQSKINCIDFQKVAKILPSQTLKLIITKERIVDRV